MECPVCDDVTLSVSAREGVEIDFCPQCRGVWLDRGELDKIIDRVVSSSTAAPAPSRSRGDRGDDRWDDRYYSDRGRDDKRRKRRSFLEDIFDFD